MYTDPIADMLNRLRLAQVARKNEVDVPFSAMKYNIALCLEQEGFIEKVIKKKKQDQRFLRVLLRYQDGEPAITSTKRISSPGQRIYKKAKELHRVRGGRGIAILSTPHGIITNKEARNKNQGGEVLCEIW